VPGTWRVPPVCFESPEEGCRQARGFSFTDPRGRERRQRRPLPRHFEMKRSGAVHVRHGNAARPQRKRQLNAYLRATVRSDSTELLFWT
jgi:hypothetical protein